VQTEHDRKYLSNGSRLGEKGVITSPRASLDAHARLRSSGAEAFRPPPFQLASRGPAAASRLQPALPIGLLTGICGSLL